MLLQKVKDAPDEDVVALRHTDKTMTSQRKIPHRPVPFERDWGDKYIEHVLPFWQKNIRSKENMHFAAELYGFPDEWKEWTEKHEDRSNQAWFYQLVLFKATYANTGRGELALDASPREGMHRSVNELLCTVLATMDYTHGLINKSHSMSWDGFVEAGVMQPVSARDAVGSIETVNEQTVWAVDDTLTSVELCYYNEPPSKESGTVRLNSSNIANSRELSTSKTHSARRKEFSITYDLLVGYILNMPDIDLMASPSTPESDRFKNDIVWVTGVEKMKKLMSTGRTEESTFNIPSVLTTDETLAYFKNPFDSGIRHAFQEQFKVNVKGRSHSRTTTVPFMWDKNTMLCSSPAFLTPSQINRVFIAPIVVHAWFTPGGPPDALDTRNSDVIRQYVQFLAWYRCTRNDEGLDRLKPHAVIGSGNYPALGAGATMLGNHDMLGGFDWLITHLETHLFYRETEAVQPFQFNAHTQKIVVLPKTIESVKARRDERVNELTQLLGRAHLVNTGFSQLEMLRSLGKPVVSIFH